SLAIDRGASPVALGVVCSDLGLSAVDEEFGSGDEACVRGSEEDGGAGHVIGITDAPEQDGQAVGRNGYSSDTRPSSTAALIKAWGSVTPSEAIATIRWAILAFIAGVGREWSIRLTAMSSADLIVVSNSGLKLASVTIGIYSLPRNSAD